MYPQTPLNQCDLPLEISNKEGEWRAFLPSIRGNENEVYKMGGSYNVGDSTKGGLISLEDARLELKYYLRDSYKINLQSGTKTN